MSMLNAIFTGLTHWHVFAYLSPPHWPALVATVLRDKAIEGIAVFRSMDPVGEHATFRPVCASGHVQGNDALAWNSIPDTIASIQEGNETHLDLLGVVLRETFLNGLTESRERAIAEPSYIMEMLGAATVDVKDPLFPGVPGVPGESLH